LPTYRPGTWFPNLFEKDPDARVEYLGQLTAAGHQPTWELRPALWMYHTVGKDTSDLVLEKILGVIELQMADPFYHNLIWSGIEGEHFEFDDGGMRQFLPGMDLEAQGDLGVKFFLTNIRYGWMFTASFGSEAEEMAARQESYDIITPALGHGWVLETQNQHRADMARVREEYLWKAITGDADTDGDWDTYVEQWMRAGGEAVLAEARAKHADM